LKGPDLPPIYADFCDKVLATHMDISLPISDKDKEVLEDKIYDFYLQKELGTHDIDNTIDAWIEYWEKLYPKGRLGLPNGSWLPYNKTKTPLESVLGEINEFKKMNPGVNDCEKLDKDIKEKANQFVFFELDKLEINYRVYVNLKPDKVHDIAEMLIEFGPPMVVNSFKFAGPGVFGTQADSLVVYCNSEKDAKEIANKINTSAGEKGVKEFRPATTEQVGSPGIGIAPEPIGTESYGRTICDSISEGIIYYQKNKEEVDGSQVSPEGLIKKFVSIWLKDEGLF